MKMVQNLRPGIFQPLGGIRESLLESISPQINMPDDLPFIRLERTFTLGVQSGHNSGRIGPPLGNRIEEKLENIIVLPSLEACAAVFCLTESAKMQATAGNNRYTPYYNILRQALMGSNSLNVMIIKVSNFRYFLVSVMLYHTRVPGMWSSCRRWYCF